MTSNFDRFYEGTISYVKELQEKLKRSEEDKMKLESKLKNIQLKYKTEDELRKQITLRESHNLLVQQQKLRNNRNDDLKDILSKIENEAKYLTAKTDRLRLLRQNYEAYMEHLYPGWRAEEEFYAIYRRNLDMISSNDSQDYHFNRNNPISQLDDLSNSLNMKQKTTDSQTDFSNRDFTTPNISFENRDKYLTSISSNIKPIYNDSSIDIFKPLNVTQSLSTAANQLSNTLKTYSTDNILVPISSYSPANKITVDMKQDENMKSNDVRNTPSYSYISENPYKTFGLAKPLNDDIKFSSNSYKRYDTDYPSKYIVPRTIAPKFTTRNLSRSNSLDTFSSRYLQNKYSQPNRFIPRSQSLTTDKYTTSRSSRASSFEQIGRDRKLSSYLLPRRSESLKYDDHVEHLYKKYVMNIDDNEPYEPSILSEMSNSSFRRNVSPSSLDYTRVHNRYDDVEPYRYRPNLTQKYNEPYRIMSSYIRQPYPTVSRSFSVSSLDDLDYLSKRNHYGNTSWNDQYPTRTYENKHSYTPTATKYPALNTSSYNYSSYTRPTSTFKCDKSTVTEENMLTEKPKPEYKKRVHYSDQLDSYQDDRDYSSDYKTNSFPSTPTRRRSSLYSSSALLDSEEDDVNHINDYETYPENKNQLNTVEERSDEDTSLETLPMNSEEPWESKIGKLRKLMKYEPNATKDLQDEPEKDNPSQITPIRDIDSIYQKSSNQIQNTQPDFAVQLDRDEKKDQEKEFHETIEFQPETNNIDRKQTPEPALESTTYPLETNNAHHFKQPDELVNPNNLINNIKSDDYKTPEVSYPNIYDSLKTSDNDQQAFNDQERTQIIEDNIRKEEPLNNDENVNKMNRVAEFTDDKELFEDTTLNDYDSQNVDTYKTLNENYNENLNTPIIEDKKHEDIEPPIAYENTKQADQENSKQITDEENRTIHEQPIETFNIPEQTIDQLQVDDTLKSSMENNSSEESQFGTSHDNAQPIKVNKDDYLPVEQQPPQNFDNYPDHDRVPHYPLDNQGYTGHPYTEQEHIATDVNVIADKPSDQNEFPQYPPQGTQDFNQEHYSAGQYQPYQEDTHGQFTTDKEYLGDDSIHQYPKQDNVYEETPPYNQPENQPQYNPSTENQPEYDQQMYYGYDTPGQDYTPNADNTNPQPDYSEHPEYLQQQPITDQPENVLQQQESLRQSPNYIQNQDSTTPLVGPQNLPTDYTTEGFENYIPPEQTGALPQESLTQSQPQPEYSDYPADQYDQYGYDQNTAKDDQNYPQYYEGDQYQPTDPNSQQYPPQQYAEYPEDGSGMQYQDQNYYDQYQNYPNQNYEEFPGQPGAYDKPNQEFIDTAVDYQNVPTEEPAVTDIETTEKTEPELQDISTDKDLKNKSPQLETSGNSSELPPKEESGKESPKELSKQSPKESGKEPVKEQKKETGKNLETKSNTKTDIKSNNKTEQSKSNTKTDQTAKSNSKTELLKSNSKLDLESKGKSPKKIGSDKTGSQDKNRASLDKTRSTDQGKP